MRRRCATMREPRQGGRMVTRWWTGMMVSLLMAAVVIAGCAKRPATTQASAPAPTGAAGATAAPSSAVTPAQPGGPATAAQPTAPGAGGQAPGTTAAPPAARPAPKEFVAVPELQDIHFDVDKYDMRPGDAKILDANAAWLKARENYLVLIEGHCDERGTNEYNLALGERRAKAAMNYLVAQGVQAGR